MASGAVALLVLLGGCGGADKNAVGDEAGTGSEAAALDAEDEGVRWDAAHAADGNEVGEYVDEGVAREAVGEGDAGMDVPGPDLGPQPSAPKEYTEGHCPAFAAGKNDFFSAGRKRTAYVYLPEQPKGAPVVFIFHGQGDSGSSIATYFGASNITKKYGAIVVSPAYCCANSGTDCCDMMSVWGYMPFSDHEPDLALFDDILSCLDEQFDIDNTRVYATGFSAGALWTTFLLLNRSDYLAATAIFSGGVGQVCDWVLPAYRTAALLAWGGEQDTYTGFIKFYEMMPALGDKLTEAGHFVAECDHGLGHTMPYGSPAWALEFLTAHKWSDGSSPFVHGLSDTFPDYCTIP